MPACQSGRVIRIFTFDSVVPKKKKGRSKLIIPEEAYEETLRRIREAEKTGALELDLSGWNKTAWEYTGLETLTRLPPELEHLPSLQSLNLSRCEHLGGDLSP